MVDREPFVPRRAGRLTNELCELDGWGDGDDEHGDAGPHEFRMLGRLVTALTHFELYDCEQQLTDVWEDAANNGTATDGAVQNLTAELDAMLERANYTPVSVDELEAALDEESLIRLRIEVDVDDYDELLIARRGCHEETIEIPKWRGLRTVEQTMTVDHRVVVHARVKPEEWFDDQGIDPSDRDLTPGHVSLKQFQNVPRADIEMLLPSTRVRFRPVDAVIVGVPALVSGIVVLTTKLASTIGLVALLVGAWLGLRQETPELDQTALVVLLGGAITLGGFLMRQWTKLKNRRLDYLKTLSENLYFRTIGDGPGVIHTLLANAVEQDVIEVLLAYRLLLVSPTGLTAAQLDEAVEAFLARDGDDVDFEIHDALAKLERLGLAESGPAGESSTWTATPLHEALRRLDRRWDDLFTYATPPTRA